MKSRNYLGLFLLGCFLLSARMDRLVLESASDFEAGQVKSAVISSDGKILSGKAVEEIKLEEAGVWSMLSIKPDQVLLGTGNKARLYQYSSGKLEKVFEDQGANRLGIPALVSSSRGEIYFSVIPRAIVYKLEKNTAKKFAEPGVNYIWSLLCLPDGSVLAGGGPRATIFLIKPDGTSAKILEPNAEMVMEIIEAEKGQFLAGTARPAMLLKFGLDGKYQVLAVFNQEELRGIKRLKDDSLLLALNQGTAPQPQMMEQAVPQSEMDSGEGEYEGQAPEEGHSYSASVQIQPRVSGKGTVYHFYSERGMRQVLSLRQATILSLFGDEQKGFFLGTDDQGKVYQILPAEDRVWLSFNLEPAKITSFAGDKSGLNFIGTSQPARLYKVLERSGPASYESKVLEAQFPSIWGRIEWRGTGKVKFLTRTGNVATPDASWSKWEPVEGPDLKIKSPPGKFIQFRAEWESGEKVELSRVELSYKNFNQTHYLSDLKIDVPINPGEGRARQISEGEGAPPPRMSASVMRQCAISWKLENPDQDRLLLELYYQMEGDSGWTLIAKGEEIRGNRYQWDASELADGWYRVKLIASDLLDNPESESFKVELISNLFLIDTTKPELNFSISETGAIIGEAKDLTSNITKIAYAIDDEDFVPVASLDSVLDQKTEKFEFKVKKLPKALHRLIISACDQANNCTTRVQEFYVK